jgi:hypothetical protein
MDGRWSIQRPENFSSLLCERTKTKVTTAVNGSLNNGDCNIVDEADARDAGLYKEAWPLIVSTGSLSESLIGKEKNRSYAHFNVVKIWFTYLPTGRLLFLYSEYLYFISKRGLA